MAIQQSKKFFVWNYFVVKNIQEKISRFPSTRENMLTANYNSKLFNCYCNVYHKSFIPCRIDYKARTVEKISKQWLYQTYCIQLQQMQIPTINIRIPMMQALSYVCDRICQNLPHTHKMAKNVFYHHLIALSIS